MPQDTFIEHHLYKYGNDKASAWVEHHMTRQENEATNENFKFLIANWDTAAGYEVPAMILVTNDLGHERLPTMVQRAKAKLVMYEAPNA